MFPVTWHGSPPTSPATPLKRRSSVNDERQAAAEPIRAVLSYEDSSSDEEEENVVVIMESAEKVHGYSFVTSNMDDLGNEIKRFNAGEIVVVQTLKLPHVPGYKRGREDQQLYVVKVWIKKWDTRPDIQTMLQIFKEGNKVKVVVRKTGAFWMVQNMFEVIPHELLEKN